MKTISDIPNNCAVMAVHLDGYEPYAIVCEKDGIMREENYSIPYALAYFLRTHWSGTEELKILHRRELANEIKRLLAI